MPLGKDRDVIYIRKAVAVEPLGNIHCVLGKIGVDNMYIYLRMCRDSVAVYKLKRKLMVSGFGNSAGINIYPERAKLVHDDGNPSLVMERREQVGIKPRSIAQVIVVASAGIERHTERNAHDVPHFAEVRKLAAELWHKPCSVCRRRVGLGI